ncbi:MAG: SpoIIE family protein phosphatase [Ignavibacteriaceae bacterium]
MQSPEQQIAELQRELEEKKRELEIEASLERVRARAMGMNKPDDLLNICEILFKELMLLGFTELRNSMINIHNDDNKSFLNYDYSDVIGKSITPMDYNTHPVMERQIMQSRITNDAFSEAVYEGKDLEEWKEFRKKYGEKDDPRIDKFNALYYYFYSIGTGTIGISTFSPISEEKLSLLKRFRNVFNLAYKRYIDISLADAQAREAQIQLALERVRARTMAMHKSDELSETSFVLFEQLKELGEKAEQFSIMIYDEKEKVIELYSTIYGRQWDETGRLPFEESPVHKKIFQAWKQKQKSLVVDLAGEELTDFNKFKMKYSKQYESENELPGNRWVIHNAFFSKGALTFSTHEPRPPETIEILERFAGVFDLTYTRFLDLIKAEAQVREAQIEASLEKIRSRSLAMQKSDELKEVITVVLQKLQELGMAMEGRVAGIYTFEEDSQDHIEWVASPQFTSAQSVHFPYFDHPVYHEFLKMHDRKGVLNKKYPRELKDSAFRYMYQLPELRNNPQSEKEWIFGAEDYSLSVAFEKHSAVGIAGFPSKLFSDSELAILKSFARVFEQSYIRFLDLKKAEAQAREAQIEAALERVRAQSMAMHKSDELFNVIRVVSEQLQQLGFRFDHVSFAEANQAHDYKFWLSVANQPRPYYVYVPYINNPMFERVKEAQLKGLSFYSDVLTPEENRQWHKHVFDHNEMDFVSKERREYIFTKGFARSIALLPNIMLIIGNYDSRPYSEEENKIINRFAAVFQQSYTRFLDLQKAEAQAREAQIEASLERVRSRTMAMHQSDELADASTVIFEQFNLLGIVPQRCGFVIQKEDESVEIWGSVKNDKGYKSYKLGTIHSKAHPIFAIGMDEWRKGRSDFFYTLKGKALNDYYKAISISTNIPEDIARKIVEETETEYHYNAFFKHGSITTIFHNPPDEKDCTVIRRFAVVLEQTYTRFLDLQKAEAQAKEAKIETALERLRSRTMAMHYSNELAEVIKLLYDQLKVLDLEIDVCIINIFKEDSKDFNLWISASGQVYPDEISVPFLNNPMFTRVFNAKDKAETLLTDRLTKEEKDEYFNHVLKHSPAGILMDEERKKDIFKEKSFSRSFALSKLTGLLIANFNDHIYTEKENDILIRFGKVFEQTYTRFLDLKKAEAQAREAKIEASLERVRSKALAMNSSEDFMAAISVFYHELSLMSHTPRRCGVGLIGKETRLVELSTFNTTTKGGSVEVIGKIKMEGHPVLNAVYENWLKKREYHVVLRGNEIKEYYQLIRPQISIPDYTNDKVQYGYFFYFDEGGVYTWTEKELSGDELQIYRRFTKVFSLAHKRYLDIKEAEARAAEAVRQASLDRIRAEIASMRTAEDLNRITPVIWRELKNLEVPFIRCGVFIIDELQELTHVYLSTPDGKSLGVLCLPFEANELVVNTVNHWREKKVYKEHWNKEEFIRWTKSMIEIGQVKEAEINQASAVPPDSLFLHLVPFRQGMLYVGNISPLTDEKLGLVKSLAEAFSIAYARYEDFHRVESAFKELDKLSKELKVKNEELENENERKAAEMEEARELQLAMLPKQIPEHPDFDIKVYMQTATEVGGDYYDFTYCNDGSINIAIGDATGHGMKAGTLVTMMKSLFIANSCITGIEEFFNSSNSAIKNSNLKRMMAAFAMLNIKDHKAKFINAGMPPLYHYIKKENEVKEIKHFNLPLGAMSPRNYKSIEFDLNTGDLLVMMSDGFPELRCDSDDLFGYERVYSSIQKAAGKEPAEIILHFKNEAVSWSENKEPEDDITFVVIKVK